MHGNRKQCLGAGWLGLSGTVRVTVVRDVKVMYSEERYMENVP